MRGLVLPLVLCACHPKGEEGAPPPRSASVTVSGSAGSVLERRFDVQTEIEGELSLTCEAPGVEGERHVLFREGKGEMRLYGILADTAYLCTLRESASGAVLWSEPFLTDPLPEDLPTLAVSGDRARASADDGYLLFNHWRLGAGQDELQRLVIADGLGRIRWYLDIPEATTGGLAGSWISDREVLVTGGGQGSAPAMRDLSGDVLYEVPDPILPEQGYHHEALLTSDGGLLSLQAVVNTKGSASFLGFRIEVRDPETGALTWEYDSQDDLDRDVLPPGSQADVDPYHANAITELADDPEGPAFWVSLRGTGTIARIDKASRLITRQVGPEIGMTLLDESGDPRPETDWFWGMHAPEIVVAGDALQMLVYDNGGRRPGAGLYSRVARYLVQGETAAMSWEWSEPRWYEPNFGSVETLPDGHVLIGTGHCVDCGEPGDTAWIVEVDPETDGVVWRLDLGRGDESLYRATALSGCEIFANTSLCPGAP